MSGLLSSGTFFIVPGTHAYEHMADNATHHGTVITNPTCLHVASHHHSLATHVLPSAAWRGREHELRDFVVWDQLVQPRWSASEPASVRSFRQAFYAP